MHLFKTEAPPPIPEGARIQFHFPEERRPDVPIPALNDALTCIRAELARLRAVLAAGEGTRTMTVLDRADIVARAASSAASAAGERSQRQLFAAVIEAAEAQAIQEAAHRARALVSSIGAERQRRDAADKAAAEIARIHAATE